MTTDSEVKERVRPPDFWNMMAREVYGMPEGWRWCKLQAVGPHDRRDLCVSMVTGAVFPNITKGPNKGYFNWKKRDRDTEQTIPIPFRDYDAFVEAWEKKTGTCSSCGGSGETIASAGIRGTTYRKCVRCNGSGKYSPVV
jgi:hypothetical protein